MKIRYLRDVTSPPAQTGKKDEVKDVSKAVAERLINGGFAKPIKKEKPNANERANPKS